MQDKNTDVNDKLILLYILDKLEIPLKNFQLMRIALENRFMNYFTYQQMIKELIHTNFILQGLDSDNTEFSITNEGKKSLQFFEDRVPRPIKNYINNNISEIKASIKNESHICTNIIENEGDFIVQCNVSESDFSLIDIKLTVGSRVDAQLICNNWKKHSQKIYSEIIHSLTNRRET